MENRKKILYFCSADHALTHAVILSLAPLLPAIKDEFDFSYSVSFFFAALNVFVYGTGGIPAGWLSDKIGPLKTLLAGIALVCFSSFALAVSPGPVWFVVFIFLLGLGSSFYHPPGLTAISNSFNEGRGRAMGTHGLIGNVGQFSAPLVAGLIAAVFGWRVNYLIWGVAFILLGLALLYLMASKADAEITTHLQEAKSSVGEPETGVRKEKRTFINRETLDLVLRPLVFIILVLSIFRGWYYRGVLYLLPFYVEDVYSLSTDSAAALGGTFLTFALISGGLGNYTGGRLKDSHGTIFPLLLFTSISLVSMLLMLFNPFTIGEADMSFMGEDYHPVLNAFVLGIFLFGFGFFGCQAPLNALIAEMVSAEKRGLLFGISFFTRFGLSALAMIMVGVAAELSLLVALSLNLAFILLALGTTLFLRKRAQKDGVSV